MKKRASRTLKLYTTLLGSIVFLVLSFGVVLALVSVRNKSLDDRSQAFMIGGEPPYATLAPKPTRVLTPTPTRRPTPTPTRRPTPTPTLNVMQCHPECPTWGCPAGYYCNQMNCPTYQGKCTPNSPTPTIPPTQCHAECSNWPCPADYRCETSGCPQYQGRCVQDNCRLNCVDSQCTNGEHCSPIGCSVGMECSNYR